MKKSSQSIMSKYSDKSVKRKSSTKSSSTKIDDSNPNPILTLEDNKYILNVQQKVQV